MKRVALVAVLSAGLFAALAVNAKGTPGQSRQVLAQTTILGSPLIINVGDDNSFQVFNDTIFGGTIGQIYPAAANTLADMGWFLRVGSTLYAPSFSDHAGGTATGGIGSYSPYTARTVSAVTGAGTAVSPYTVTVQGMAAGGYAITQTVTYVNGDNYFRKAFRVDNSGASPVPVRIFLASDLFLAASDAGRPFREGVTGSPGGQTCAGVNPVYTILHVSQGLPAANGYTADAYGAVWTQVGANVLNNAVNSAPCIDNGAALQWDVTIPAFGSSTVQALTSFGDIPAGLGGAPAVPAPALDTYSLAGLALALLALAAVAMRQKA